MNSRRLLPSARARGLTFLWIVRAFLPVSILVGVVAGAQEEWQRKGRTGPRDFVATSEINDNLFLPMPGGSQAEMKTEGETTLKAPLAGAQEEWQRQDHAGPHDFVVNSQPIDTQRITADTGQC